MPEVIAKKIFKPLVVRKLKQSGIPAGNALKYVNDEHPLAKNALINVMEESPVIINRAPSLHKHSVQAFRPILMDGKDIRLNPMVVSGFNADFDGDSVSSYLSITYDFENPVVKDLINLLKENVDFDSFNSYLAFLNLKKESIKMIYNDFITIVEKGGITKNIHIKDFPHSNNILKQTETTEEYEVPEFIQVFALDNGIVRPLPVTAWSIHKNLEMFDIKLQSSKKVTASADHSLICFNPETGKVEKMRPADALGKLTPLPMRFGIKEPNPENCKSFDEGYFIGAVVGDGWTNGESTKYFSRGKNQIMLSSNDLNISAKVSKFLEKPAYTISNTHDFQGHSSFSTKHTWSDGDWAKYLRENIGQGAENKKLPDDFLNAGKEYRFGLLSGLIDTDGSVTEVKAVAKNKSQYQANYTTISEILKYQIQQLCASIGVRTSITEYERNGNVVYHISISMVDLLKIRENISLEHAVKKEILERAEVSKDQKDVVPISYSLATKMQKYMDRKAEPSLYVIISKAKNTGIILRETGEIFCKKYRMQDEEFKTWKDEFLYNENLTWDRIKEITSSKETTGWDLTIPGPYVFMTSDLITVQDTMSVMLPITYEGQQEAFGMFPSKILFKHGDNSLMPGLSQEFVYGISKLSEIEADTGKTFKSIDDAKAAKLDFNAQFTLNGKKMTIGQ